jgi:dihydrofolate reductase
MRLSIIVAISENNAIGRGNALPWRLPADLRRFKERTLGHALIMGRRTYESLGRTLPGRTSIVITKSDLASPGVFVVRSFDEALQKAREIEPEEAFVIGGRAVFAAALPVAERLYVTFVHAQVAGDVFFPERGLEGWVLLEDERHDADARHPFPYSFRVYGRGAER